MHLHFVFPKWRKLLEDHPELKESLSGYDLGSFRMAGLGLSTAAGAVPSEHTVSLCDENVEQIDYSVEADLICIGMFTPQAVNAYEISAEFRRRGKKVIAGGIHATVQSVDSAPHFDAVMRGPAEGLWPEVLNDLRNGALKPVYTGDLNAPFARPNRALFQRSGYLRAGVVQTARGCPINCPFCVLPAHVGTSLVFRPIEEVLEDVAELPYPCFFFADENLLFADSINRDYRRELFSALRARKNRKLSFIASYPQFLKQLSDEDLSLLTGANVRQIYLVMGLRHGLCEELSDRALTSQVLKMEAAGIEVLASFTLGHDDDRKPVEGLLADFCASTKVNLAEFILSTPFPGTAAFAQLEKQGRIRTKDWSRYNGANVVFEPLHQSAEELQARYLALWEAFYKPINRTGVNTRFVKAFGGEVLRTR